MSSLICEVCKVDNIEKHPNADRLEIATVKGWQCVVLKEKYKIGDEIVYIPIDSMIPFRLSDKIGITNYLHNQEKDGSGNILFGRVKTIRLRGVISQGLVIDKLENKWKLGQDVKELLGIKKYEQKTNPANNKWSRGKTYDEYWRLPALPNFPKYTDIENFKNYQNVIEDNEEVVISEKIHGCNFRCSLQEKKLVEEFLPRKERIKFKLQRILNKVTFGFFIYDPYIFLVGSRNCNLRDVKRKDNDLMNAYWKIAKRFELDQKLEVGEVIYGEIYGDGVQFLTYGEKDITVKFFDLFKNGKYVDFEEFISICKERGLPNVPILYKGKLEKEILVNLSKGNSYIANHIKEGVVVKPVKERYDHRLGRVILKYINDDYLVKLSEENIEDNIEH